MVKTNDTNCRVCKKQIDKQRIKLYDIDVQKYIEPDLCFDCIWKKVAGVGISRI